MVVGADGSIVVGYSGMRPFSSLALATSGVVLAGPAVYAGAQSGRWVPPAALSASDGTFAAPSPVGVTVAASGSVPTEGADPFAGASTVAWHCTGGRMTFSADGALSTRWVLARVR